MKVFIQYAHHSHDEFDEIRGKSDQEILELFDEFDWAGEVSKANELEKCSPTISVETTDKRRLVWVSAVGTDFGLEFISECSFPGIVSAWFGLSKKQGTVSLDTQNFSTASARKALELFLSGNERELRALYQDPA